MLDKKQCKNKEKGCTWTEARDICLDHEGYMAEILDEKQHKEIMDEIFTGDLQEEMAWFGLKLQVYKFSGTML